MKRMLLQGMQRFLALLFCALLAPAQIFHGQATADVVPVNFPQAKARSQSVRVALTRLQVADRMDIVLDGVYSLGNRGENSMIFKRGSELTFMNKNGSLHVYYQGMSFNAGSSLYLTRYQGEEGKENGIRLAGEEALYEGDLQLNVDGASILPILTIHVEDYLLGVVPYEMSNDFPLEALKAQAVTARTYALRKQDPSKAYDLVDTTNDQVYKGKLKGYDRAAQAVTETRGLCGFYKDKLAECFYAASNGGQTELVENVWSKGDYGYYAMNDDPYDLENPQSLVKVYTLPKKPEKAEDISYGLRALLVKELEEALVAKGYDPAPESLRVDEVLSVSTDVPAFASPSRVMTTLNLQLSYSGRTRTDAEALPQAAIQAVEQAAKDDDEEVSLFETTAPPATAALFLEETPIPTATPVPTPKPVYGPFEKVEQAAVLHIPLFPDAANALGLSLNGAMNNELITVVEDKREYTLESRRYGHGIGMSQRGAEWMAAQYGKTYLDILNFYYPGLTVKQYPEADGMLPVLDTEQLATPGPRPTPTPRPTLMPVTGKAESGHWYAIVSEIAEDSTLNLRATPDMSGEIVLRLFKNQRLLVLERCLEAGWVKVKTDVVEGYVMEKFLKAE